MSSCNSIFIAIVTVSVVGIIVCVVYALKLIYGRLERIEKHLALNPPSTKKANKA